jgi:hypothetical protein
MLGSTGLRYPFNLKTPGFTKKDLKLNGPLVSPVKIPDPMVAITDPVKRV